MSEDKAAHNLASLVHEQVSGFWKGALQMNLSSL